MKIAKATGLSVISMLLLTGRVWAAATFPPDIKLTIPTAPAEVQFGQDFNYELVVENIGEDSSNEVSLVAGLPTEGSFVSVSTTKGTCQVVGLAPNQKLNCDFGIVAPLAPITVTVTWKAPQVETTLQLNGEATGTGENIDTTGDNAAAASTDVVQPPAPPADDGGADDNGAEAAGDGGCSLGQGISNPHFLLSGFGVAGALALGLRLRRRPQR